MTMQEFQEQFGTEKACGEYLYKKRRPKCFVCPKCGHSKHFDIKSLSKHQCKTCNHQTTVRRNDYGKDTDTADQAVYGYVSCFGGQARVERDGFAVKNRRCVLEDSIHSGQPGRKIPA